MKRILVACMVTVLAGACGVPTDDDATVTDPEAVPFELLEPASTTSTTTPTGVDEELFFIGPDGLLRSTVRRVPEPLTLTEVVDELSTAPQNSDLRTALGDELVDNVDSTGGIAQVDLGPEFTTLPVDDQVLALAQIVYTLTSQAGVGRVSFELEGTPVPIPRGDGVITTDSVSRDAYANLVAPAV